VFDPNTHAGFHIIPNKLLEIWPNPEFSLWAAEPATPSDLLQAPGQSSQRSS